MLSENFFWLFKNRSNICSVITNNSLQVKERKRGNFCELWIGSTYLITYLNRQEYIYVKYNRDSKVFIEWEFCNSNDCIQKLHRNLRRQNYKKFCAELPDCINNTVPEALEVPDMQRMIMSFL